MKCTSSVHQNLIPCKNQECQHHFAFNMDFQQRPGKDHSFRETEASSRSLNCMCLLNSPLSQDEISEMFGVTKMQVWKIEGMAKKHFTEKMGV